jgi:hypothetical protein
VVIKGPGRAEVVIQGPGGWEIELDMKTAEDWLWHCGLCQTEIEGWTYQTKLRGGEKIIFLKNPKRGIAKKEADQEEEQPGFALRRLEQSLTRRNITVNVKKIDQTASRTKNIDKAWKWATKWISQNGIGSITRGGRIWKLEQFEEDDLICAVRKIALPILLIEEERRTVANPQRKETERRRRPKPERQTIDENTLNIPLPWGYWKEKNDTEIQEIPWKEIKKRLSKDKSAQAGFQLLRGWTGQDREKAEKSGVRSLPLHPGWYEINWKVLKKRLKKDQAGLAKLREEWVAVNPLEQVTKKGWEFLGFVSKGTTTEIPELQEDQEEMWVETPGNSGWRPITQAETEMREALKADWRVMLNHRGVYDKHFELEPGDCVHVNNPLNSAKKIVVWDLSPFASELSLEETQSLLKRRLGWIRRGRVALLKNERPWTGWDISGASTLRFIWKDKILCKCDGEEIMLWGDQVNDCRATPLKSTRGREEAQVQRNTAIPSR